MNDLCPQRNQSVSLCDALDRLLATGVVALGELKISVADVDLIYIGLQLVVKSIETGRALDPTVDDWPQPRRVARSGPPERMVTEAGRPKYESYGSSRSSPTLARKSHTLGDCAVGAASCRDEAGNRGINPLLQPDASRPIFGCEISGPGGESDTDSRLATRLDEPMAPQPAGHGPDKGGGGLGKLVLTLVKVLHKLLKLQALRRMEAGSLSAAEMEGLGVTLMRQAQEIERMAKELGLQPEDLNLDLGPLGKLL